MEDVDPSAHPSPHGRRTPNLRTPVSSPGQRYQELGARNSDLGVKAGSELANQRSPKPGHAAAGGGRTPEPVSRRTEISIDISSKQVDSSPSPGISRFGLKRPEVPGHSKAPEQAHRRAEVSLARPQEAPPARRADPATSASRIPEPVHRKVEPTGPGDAPSRRAEINVIRAPEGLAPAKPPVNSHAPAASVPSTHHTHKAPALGSDIRVRSPDGKSAGVTALSPSVFVCSSWVTVWVFILIFTGTFSVIAVIFALCHIA